MNSKQDNKFKSYLAVKSVCDTNDATWSALVAFGTTYTRFLTSIETISALSRIQTQSASGVAQAKRDSRRAMCEAALEVAGATRACATAGGNQELAAKVSFTLTGLLGGRSTASADRCVIIHEAASANLALLGDYGVTAAKLAGLQGKIDGYKTYIQKPRNAIVAVKTATDQLPLEFRAADELLKSGLDQLILQYKTSAPKFFSDYSNARFIVESAATLKSGDEAAPQPKAA